MRIIYLTLITFIATGTVLCSCGSKSSTSMASDSAVVNDSLPVDVTDIVKAVANNDSVSFSSHVNYPLERPYPLKDIQNEKEMKAYYPVLMDDSLRNVLAKSSSSEWSEAGWRGWTVKDGQYLWIDGDVYAVNYISSREKTMKDSLVRREKASLPANIRAGWTPEWVMEDIAEGTVYRIDADSISIASAQSDRIGDGTYRLAVYQRGGDLRRHPERILRGKRKIEGTAGSVFYYFSESPMKEMNDSVEYVIEIYSAETGAPRLYHREKKRDIPGQKVKKAAKDPSVARDTVVDHDLKKIYWLDRVNDVARKDSLKS
ncbi:MAG: hypothetical protein K2K81_02030 [Muribaculaceae bacterium]|nr:hypothetical protein [Muribaculaceae bacterium]